MKRTCTFLAAILLAALANGAEPAPQDQQLIALIREVQAQQAVIVDNQSKIDTRIATVTEALRVARIYSSRGGR